MSRNIYCNPSLIIDNKEVDSLFKAAITFKGNNHITKCKITIKGTDLSDYKLFKKEVQVFMNLGSIDSVPIFRGYIVKISPSTRDLNLDCSDARYLLAGNNSPRVVIDDTFNYDGYTLAQFTDKWIRDRVNTDRTYIGLNMLRETQPAQPFSTSQLQAFREDGSDAYNIIKKAINLNRDTTGDIPKEYEIVMVDDGNVSNIAFIKDKDLDSTPSIRLSYTDGIKSLKFKKEPNPTFAMVGQVRFNIGNEPNGAIALQSKFLPDLEAFSEMPGLVSQMILEELEKNRLHDDKDIKVVATKGHYLSIGDIVYLDVEERDVTGPHKVTGKQISVGGGNMDCQLTLNKKIETMEDVIQ